MKTLLSLLLMLSVVPAASAVTILSETFDYADQAALQAAWNANTNNPTYMLDPTFGNPEPSYKMPSPPANSQGKLGRNLGANYLPTDAEPLVMSFDLYLHDAGAGALWNGARHYVELRGYSGDALNSGSLENLLALGVNNSSADAFSNTYYQGRVTFGSNWSTLDEEAGAVGRSIGWHRMAVEINSTQVKFYVDGILAEIEARPNAFGFDSLILGADLTANGHIAWVDNLKVEVIPEPAGLALLALGGLCLLRRR